MQSVTGFVSLQIRRERRLQDESGESLLAQGSAVHEVDDIDDDPNAIGERHSGTARYH